MMKMMIIKPKEKVVNEVVVQCIQDKAQLVRCLSHYPIRLLRQEAWKPFISLVMMGFGGGIVAGDSIVLNVAVEIGCILCLKTVGSTNVFKMVDGEVCKQSISANIAKDSLLAYLPDPNCCFNGSCLEQVQTYRVQSGGSLVAVDWYCSGRQERDDLWGANCIANRLMLYEEQELVLLENQALRSDVHGHMRHKLGNAAAFGLVILSGPHTVAVRADLQCLAQRRSFTEELAELSHRGRQLSSLPTNCWVSVANLSANTTLLRFSVCSVEYGYELLLEVLRPLEQLLSCAPYAERRHYQQRPPDLAKDHPYDPINKLREHRLAASPPSVM